MFLACKLSAAAIEIAGVAVPVAMIVSPKLPPGECGLPFIGILAQAFLWMIGLFLAAAVLDKLAELLRRS